MKMRTYHSRGRVDDLHLLQNGGTVVRDQNFAFGGLDLEANTRLLVISFAKNLRCAVSAREKNFLDSYHFVHTTGAKRGSDNIGDGCKQSEARLATGGDLALFELG